MHWWGRKGPGALGDSTVTLPGTHMTLAEKQKTPEGTRLPLKKNSNRKLNPTHRFGVFFQSFQQHSLCCPSVPLGGTTSCQEASLGSYLQRRPIFPSWARSRGISDSIQPGGSPLRGAAAHCHLSGEALDHERNVSDTFVSLQGRFSWSCFAHVSLSVCDSHLITGGTSSLTLLLSHSPEAAC